MEGYLIVIFCFVIHHFSALGQVKQTTFMSRLGFIPPYDPERIIVKQARKKSKHSLICPSF